MKKITIANIVVMAFTTLMGVALAILFASHFINFAATAPFEVSFPAMFNWLFTLPFSFNNDTGTIYTIIIVFGLLDIIILIVGIIKRKFFIYFFETVLSVSIFLCAIFTLVYTSYIGSYENAVKLKSIMIILGIATLIFLLAANILYIFDLMSKDKKAAIKASAGNDDKEINQKEIETDKRLINEEKRKLKEEKKWTKFEAKMKEFNQEMLDEKYEKAQILEERKQRKAARQNKYKAQAEENARRAKINEAVAKQQAERQLESSFNKKIKLSESKKRQEQRLLLEARIDHDTNRYAESLAKAKNQQRKALIKEKAIERKAALETMSSGRKRKKAAPKSTKAKSKTSKAKTKKKTTNKRKKTK